MNEFEMRARASKVSKLVAVMEKAKVTSHDALDMDDTSWALAEAAAGIERASERTREATIMGLRIRELEASQDPFRGL